MRGRHRARRNVYRAGIAVALLAAGCGDDSGTKDAAPPTVDIDNGSCGDQLRFTGEIVDWDETDAHFCGVFEAIVADGENGGMDTTAPNGRYDLCIPRDQGTRTLTVTPSANPSGCTTPSSTYTTPAILVGDPTTIQQGTVQSGRLFTEARKTEFFATMGIAYDTTKAQLFVHVDTARQVSLDAMHTHAPAWNFTTVWAAGDTGTNVFFPNVSADKPVVVGGVTVPLMPNTISFVSLK